MRQNNIVKKALDKIDQGPLIYKTLLFKMYQEILLATTAYNRKRVFHPIIASHCMLYILITVTIDVNRTIVDIFSSLTLEEEIPALTNNSTRPISSLAISKFGTSLKPCSISSLVSCFTSPLNNAVEILMACSSAASPCTIFVTSSASLFWASRAPGSSFWDFSNPLIVSISKNVK